MSLRDDLIVVRDRLDVARYDLRATDVDAAFSYVGEASRLLTLVIDAQPIDPPPPLPTPPAIHGVAVTYAKHDPARDCYLGYTDAQVAWGPHHGIPFIAPCDGVVSLYRFPTPLPASTLGLHNQHKDYLAYLGQHQAIFGGPFRCSMTEADLVATGQTLYFVLFAPNAPLAGLKALWFGHARGNARLGPVKIGDWFGESWDSGIRFEAGGVPDARAAHVHCCASTTGQLTMNGDVDGLRAAAAMGWHVEFIGSNGPGPDQYYTGAYTAGRLRTDFTSGHHPIPPMPS